MSDPERYSPSFARSSLGPLRSLNAGRGVAALAVVLFHINEMFRAGRVGAGGDLFMPLHYGFAGVEYFFVLSGFLMMRQHHRHIGRPGAAATFLIARARRIYPLYWLVTLMVAPIYFAVPGLGEGTEASLLRLVASLSLLPSTSPPIVGVAWTLQYEMLFYCLFALLLWRPARGLAAFGLIAAGPMIGVRLPGVMAGTSHPIMLLFLFGMGAARLPALRPGVARVAAITGMGGFVVIIVGFTAWDAPYQITRIAVGLAAAMAIAGAAAWEESAPAKRAGPLAATGTWSYALYLVHYPVIAAIAALLRLLQLQDAPRPLVAALLLGGSIAAAIAAHALVERPIARLLRSGMLKRSPAPVAQSARPGAIG